MLTSHLLAQIPLTPRATEPQSAWRTAIAAYLYLAGFGAGAFVAAVILDWLGLLPPAISVRPIAGWTYDWSPALVLWGPLAAAVGACWVLLHLGRNWFLFPTACRNLRTAWMARGFVVLASFIVLGMAIASVAVFLPEGPARLPVVWRMAQVVALVFAVGTAVYTGVLLHSERYIPAWTAPVIPPLFLASALTTGVAGQIVSLSVYRALTDEPTSIEAAIRALVAANTLLIGVQAALLVFYMRHLRGGEPEARASGEMLLSGSSRLTFWVAVVGGLLLPFLLSIVGLATGTSLPSVVAALSVLMGGFLLRLGILGVGIRAAPPLYKLSRWYSEHVAESDRAPDVAPQEH